MLKRENEEADPNFTGYRCYLLGPDGIVAQRIELQAADDEAALAESQAALGASEFHEAELWCLDRLIGPISKHWGC
jgi:hypothetical protein